MVVVSEQYHPKVGGAVRYVDGLVGGLVKTGCKVRLVVPVADAETEPPPLRSLGPDSLGGRLEVVGVSAPGDVHGAWKRRNRRRFVANVASLLEDRLEEWGPCLLHVAYGHHLYRALRDIDAPSFWTVHNVPPAESQRWLGYPRSAANLVGNVEAIGYGLVSGVVNRLRIVRSPYACLIAVSYHVADKVRPWALRSDVEVVGEGFAGTCCEIEELGGRRATPGAGGSEYSILTVAGIVPHKGQHIALDAARKLARSDLLFRWNLVGPVRDSDYAARLQDEIRRAGLDDRIRLVGTVGDGELCEHYTQADLYVQPSLEEGYCLGVLEALGHGTPVVGTPTGAIPELVAAGEGRIVSGNDGELIADAIGDWVEREWTVSRRREVALQIREKYGWSAVAKRFLELYSQYG